ncbi:Uncharacterised protein [Mycobacteroides abscessus subsp. abscessus]|nr:Uncharacterised protein [Mycobacteroides abscessus subsp. abscessus]
MVAEYTLSSTESHGSKSSSATTPLGGYPMAAVDDTCTTRCTPCRSAARAT